MLRLFAMIFGHVCRALAVVLKAFAVIVICNSLDKMHACVKKEDAFSADTVVLSIAVASQMLFYTGDVGVKVWRHLAACRQSFACQF